MNEYEKITKVVIKNVSAGKMKYEDAMIILTSLFSIAESNKFFIDNKPYIPTVTWTDVSTSAESLLKHAKTLSHEENENNVEV